MKRSDCVLCAKPMRRIFEMPRFPLTECYEPHTGEFLDTGYKNQALLYCESCNHGQLENVLPSDLLYGPGYETRSARSIGSRVAISNFARFIKEHGFDGRETIIDIGGNDASLVSLFDGLEKVIIDPNASGAAKLVKSYIEDADLNEWADKSKLIVSSHTLEHLVNPDAFMRKVSKVMKPGDLLAIQLPSLECLVEDARIEQIHHQHLHYYTLRSMSALLARHGLEIYVYQYDYDHYGALQLLAHKGHGETVGKPVSVMDLIDAQATFKFSIQSCAWNLSKRDFIIFGAALMLPVFAYYLPRISSAEFIADNDKAKNGMRYINFNVPIRSEYELRGRDVLIGAINTKLACRELTKIAFEKGARNVITPLHLL